MTLEDRCKIADLYTEYGALLTKKQADILRFLIKESPILKHVRGT